METWRFGTGRPGPRPPPSRPDRHQAGRTGLRHAGQAPGRPDRPQASQAGDFIDFVNSDVLGSSSPMLA